MTKFVAYYRVSTKRQGQSGLGLEAQQSAVRAFIGGGQIVAEFTEVESGKRNDRPELAAALAAARAHRAVLVVAKLDRLARNVEFTAKLMNSGVEFVACDVPSANKLTIHILAAVAEAERDAISARTKAALAQSTKKLGGKREKQRAPTEAERATAARVKRENAATRAADIVPLIHEIKAAGITSAAGVAKALNDRGIRTARGGHWQAIQVQRVLEHTR